ncbi:hypothetical protein LCGC14_3047290, partial [marine sediment metagenome]
LTATNHEVTKIIKKQELVAKNYLLFDL